MIKKYRKKPTEIEAIQYLPDEKTFEGMQNVREVLEFVGKHGGIKNRQGSTMLIIQNNGIDEMVRPGDYIIKSAFGDFSRMGSKDFKIFFGEIVEEEVKKEK